LILGEACSVVVALLDEMALGTPTSSKEHEGKELERLDQDRTRQKVLSI
jgi:hypothetical protein